MKILVSDPITEAGLSILKEAGLDVIYLPEGSEDEKNKAAFDVDGWIIRSGTHVKADMINSAQNLQVIGRAGGGVDNIDIIAATRKAFAVIRLDNPLDEDGLNTLAGINELESVKQIHVSN